MANYVTYEANPDIENLRMSGGLTSVFVSALSLSSSALAESDRHREFAAWFASHDQEIYGGGMVSFDLSELPWSPATFASDREFVLRVIEAARAKTGWARLEYEPNEELLLPALDKFVAMIQALKVEHASGRESQIWAYGGRPSQWTLCPIHKTYQHTNGCALCNDPYK